MNFSKGTPAYPIMCDNFSTLLKLMQPSLVRIGMATQEDITFLYVRAMEEMRNDNFRAIAFSQSAWGKKTGGSIKLHQQGDAGKL
jgi:hypothetical protein